MSALADFKINFIEAIDGTKIGYREIGSGPGVILVHGGLQSSLNFTMLAKLLSVDFTVYIPDRRGRGLSGPYNPNDTILTEARDMLALARHTNTEYIFGLSSGAILTLQAAVLEPVFKKIALYEPPIPLNEHPFKKMGIDYEAAMSKGNFGKAFITIVKGTGDTSFFGMLPGFITVPLVNMLMKAQLKNPKEDELPLQELVSTFHYDRMIVKDSLPLLEKAKNISAEVLLLGGAKSQAYFIPVLEQLQRKIPNARRMAFEKLGHLGADNSGTPEKVANELQKFFN
ncbi:MAG: alpha/beta hydrolase [Bacteroidetes bacterium]|nr:alpha/beta hydrolase [Bacteroidota bacterium]